MQIKFHVWRSRFWVPDTHDTYAEAVRNLLGPTPARMKEADKRLDAEITLPDLDFTKGLTHAN